jgi:dipeptidyl aminopeptidase/acylaminoacyl peptidase
LFLFLFLFFLTLALSETITFTYKGADGDDVQAFFFKPAHFVEGKKYPLLLLIHGGPETPWQDNFHFRWNVQPFTAQGYASVEPNIHGSGSFGDAFRESIIGDWGGKPYVDLMMLLDALGNTFDWIDTENIGALGASYGGYMINWLNSQTTRFNCLVCHDGMFDVDAFFYYTDEVYFIATEFLGTPYDTPRPEPYDKFNPAKFVGQMQTPQLVIHGSTDYRIPDVSGIGMFTALQSKGVDSRLVLFPEENHWVMNPNNSIEWHNEILAWLDKYMKANE